MSKIMSFMKDSLPPGKTGVCWAVDKKINGQILVKDLALYIFRWDKGTLSYRKRYPYIDTFEGLVSYIEGLHKVLYKEKNGERTKSPRAGFSFPAEELEPSEKVLPHKVLGGTISPGKKLRERIREELGELRRSKPFDYGLFAPDFLLLSNKEQNVKIRSTGRLVKKTKGLSRIKALSLLRTGKNEYPFSAVTGRGRLTAKDVPLDCLFVFPADPEINTEELKIKF